MSKESETPTFDLRRELLKDDIKAYADKSRSDRDRINTFRQWEITLLASVAGFALSKGNIRSYLFLLIAIVIAFALLEIVNRGRMNLRTRLVLEIEEMVMNRDDKYILENYVFATTRWINSPTNVKTKCLLLALASTQFIVWNTSFVILIALLFLYART